MRSLPSLAMCAAIILVQPALADPTDVEVRVIARGAKFLGGYAAPVGIVMTDADTGETLARGTTSGTTGDTQRIMAGERGARKSDADSAVFRARLDIDRPRRVTVQVTGPLSQPQAVTTATSTQWILPGHHLTAGDGWLIELPGLIVDIADPMAYQWVKKGETVRLRAGVTMLCGCALSENGPWRASDAEVEAHVTVNGASAGPYKLQFDAASASFGASIPATAPGLYEIEVRAWMGPSNNAGVARAAFFVR
ncbi:hypothetical protein OMP43_04675 [Sphingomonas sp. CBMAI 2297]|uniref:hypothetical protein n=1 Tax=Sphingomonas sp. CBMAI 2297 TaxID=2991720 RepID=UPI002456FB39|nr:hypothetical protein [Sphingomonas sp. CBMAI 2297]MDH4743306.1 hypothetical protein [Sphingomonas sp. CBMAI 2297]